MMQWYGELYIVDRIPARHKYCFGVISSENTAYDSSATGQFSICYSSNVAQVTINSLSKMDLIAGKIMTS
jgi:hypothetical protein